MPPDKRPTTTGGWQISISYGFLLKSRDISSAGGEIETDRVAAAHGFRFDLHRCRAFVAFADDEGLVFAVAFQERQRDLHLPRRRSVRNGEEPPVAAASCKRRALADLAAGQDDC